MWAALMAAAAPIQLYDSYFLIEPIESCCEKPAAGDFSDAIGARLFGPSRFSLIPFIIASGAG